MSHKAPRGRLLPQAGADHPCRAMPEPWKLHFPAGAAEVREAGPSGLGRGPGQPGAGCRVPASAPPGDRSFCSRHEPAPEQEASGATPGPPAVGPHSRRAAKTTPAGALAPPPAAHVPEVTSSRSPALCCRQAEEGKRGRKSRFRTGGFGRQRQLEGVMGVEARCGGARGA